ncbi:MAG: Sec-independent protein translocase protein TatB [Alphaproteobacteria bacterium MarineAlpha6_Bin4]|nr:MAG: Sec-independent protein translocase protein TatB [Alphaproteobacteria bacterium MarineAlpha6_Bin4]
MFNIGWTELLLVTVVFLIFVKPADIPFFIKKIIKFFYMIKNYISEVTDEFKAELYVDEFKKKNKEILKIEKELKKLKKK